MGTRALLFLLIFAMIASQQIRSVSAADAKASTQVQQEDEIRKVLAGISEASSSGTADGVAAAFSEDAVLIDDAGEETRGRAALRERFARASTQKPGGGAVVLHPGRISFPAGNVAIVTGEVGRKNGDVEMPATRFSMVLVKQGSAWLINEATETAMLDIKASDYLRPLQWLIGNWQVNGSDGAIKLKVEWANGHNFIHSKCIRTNAGAEQVDDQIIGWDPRRKAIVSWHFDSNGGFGNGRWHKADAGKWVVEFSGTSSGGDTVRASNEFVIKGADEFTWKEHQDNPSAEAAPSLQPVTLVRVKS